VSAGRVESELKFWAADERPLDALAAAPVLGPAELGPARAVDELDRYLDTADLRLAAARWACRIRNREGRTILSMKGPAEHAAGDAVHRRSELEGGAGPGLDPSGWPPSPARDLLVDVAGGAPLLERFTLAQHRTERSVTLAGAPVGLLSLDRSRVLHRATELGLLLVVELEFRDEALAAGLDPRPLAAALGAMPGLVHDPLSKLERALAMVAAAAR
jgi:inorganic triphosphatase YgiF